MSEFIAEHGGVTWLTSRGPIRLNEQMVEGLLDLFGEADDLAAAKLFNELHEESLKLGGIERCSPHLQLRGIDPSFFVYGPEV